MRSNVQASRFCDYAELVLMRVLEAAADPVNTVRRAAEQCGETLATHLPPHVCLHTLNPLVKNTNGVKLAATLKMIATVRG